MKDGSSRHVLDASLNAFCPMCFSPSDSPCAAPCRFRGATKSGSWLQVRSFGGRRSASVANPDRQCRLAPYP